MLNKHTGWAVGTGHDPSILPLGRTGLQTTSINAELSMHAHYDHLEGEEFDSIDCLSVSPWFPGVGRSVAVVRMIIPDREASLDGGAWSYS